MQKQLAKIVNHGIYYIIYDDSKKWNHFIVKVKANGHTRNLDAYADFGSAMECIINILKLSNNYWREAYDL